MEEKLKFKNLKQKTKLILILSAEFIAITLLLVLILFAGKKTHKVTFDLNGGILIGGEVEQYVIQGQNATPPRVAKHGHYLKGWSGSYSSVTQDITVKAIWEYETSPGVEYYVPGNTNYCEISGCFKEIQGELFIGAYYSNRPVLGIRENSFKNMTGLTAIHLLDGILSIKSEAFAGCTNLEVFDMPGTVIRIGQGAFKNCESIKAILLPNTLQTIEEGAFENCKSLTELVIPDSVDTIRAGAFRGCEGLETLVISSGIEVIEEGAFAGCTSLKEIVIPESVLTIGKNAFMGCTSLESIVLYRDPVFSGEVEEESTEAGENEKTDDKSVDDETNEEATDEKAEEEVIKGVTKICEGAFAGCESLKEIIIPESVIEIEAGAFDTAEMTINLYISKEALPEGYAEGWCPEDATLVFDYVEEKKPEEEAEDGEKDEEKDKDKDKDKKDGIWG